MTANGFTLLTSEERDKLYGISSKDNKNKKSYTDIEQSKKLAKILPIESADMGWYYSRNPNVARNQMWVGTKTENADIPCWSLAALLNVLPSSTLDSSDNHRYRFRCMERYTEWYDNAIDACVAMIERLHELKML